MTNGTKILTGEFLVAILYSSWGSIKWGFAPWPGNYVKIGISFGILGILSMASEKLAALMGAGFIIAILVRDMSKGSIQAKPNLPVFSYETTDGGKTYIPSAMGGKRPESLYMPLYFGAALTSNSTSTPTPRNAPSQTPQGGPVPQSPSGTNGTRAPGSLKVV